MTGGVRPPLLKRLGPGWWVALDAAVAVAAAAGTVAWLAMRRPAELTGPPAGPVIGYMLGLAATLPLAVRRRYPLTVTGVTLVASVALLVLVHATATVTGATLGLYMAAASGERRRALAALAATLAGVAVVYALVPTHPPDPATRVLSGALSGLIQVMAWLVGDSVRRRRVYAAWLAGQAARQAVARERLRIARDLHDVVAHALSVIAVQAGVGRHVAAVRPAEAEKALGAIEVITREALVEMRRLLGVLHEDDPPLSELAPAPGLADLDRLAARVSAAGLPTTLHIEGRVRPVPPGVDVSAYRIVQEALTNTLSHARDPHRATVMVCYQPAEVRVEVADDGAAAGPAASTRRAAGSGRGLAGMRERVSLLGGQLTAAPRSGGGFTVTARLPIDGASR